MGRLRGYCYEKYVTGCYTDVTPLYLREHWVDNNLLHRYIKTYML